MTARATALLLAVAGPALAAPPPPQAAPAPDLVLVLPLRRFVQVPEDEASAVEVALADGIAGRPGLAPVSPGAFLTAVTSGKLYADRLALARDLVEEGVRDHERMRLDEAIRKLDKARGLFRETFQSWVDPSAVAEAHLTLALAYLESGHRDRAHLTFKDLLALDPARRLPVGYYSPPAIEAFGVAQADFFSTADLSLPPAEAVRLGRAAGARYVVSAHLRSRARGGAALVVALQDARDGRVLDRESLPAGHGAAAWRVDRLTSRLLACMRPDEPEGPKEDPFAGGRWLVGVDVSGALFRERPVRESFVHLGLSLRGDFLVRPHLVALGRLTLARSTGLALSQLGEDGYDYEDLRDPLDTATILLGIGPRLAGRGGSLAAYAALGIEATAPTAVRITGAAECKWGPPYSCRARRHDPRLAVGGGALAGVTWALLGPVQLQAEVGVSYYAAAVGDNELNLPIRVAVGLGYRF